MYDWVVRIKHRQDDQLKAPKDVLLFELQLILDLQNLVLVKNERVKFILVNREVSRQRAGPLGWRPLFGSQVSPYRAKEASSPNELDVESVLHLLEVIGWVFNCDLSASLVSKVVPIHVLKECASDPQPLLSWKH